MQSRLGPGKRPPVVGHHDQQRIVENFLPRQFIDNLTDEGIKPRHLVAIRSQISPCGRIVDEKRGYVARGVLVSRSVEIFPPISVTIPVTMGIERRKPKKERFVARPLANCLHPLGMTTTIAGGESFFHDIKRCGRSGLSRLEPVDRHMVLSNQRREIPCLPHEPGKPGEVRSNWLVQFARPAAVVWIAAGDDARPAR